MSIIAGRLPYPLARLRMRMKRMSYGPSKEQLGRGEWGWEQAGAFADIEDGWKKTAKDSTGEGPK